MNKSFVGGGGDGWVIVPQHIKQRAKRNSNTLSHTYIPCKLLFSFSILISRICSMMAFLHSALNSLADLLRPTISAHDALWGTTPSSGSVFNTQDIFTHMNLYVCSLNASILFLIISLS